MNANEVIKMGRKRKRGAFEGLLPPVPFLLRVPVLQTQQSGWRFGGKPNQR
jgi:hypothetical protein